MDCLQVPPLPLLMFGAGDPFCSSPHGRFLTFLPSGAPTSATPGQAHVLTQEAARLTSLMDKQGASDVTRERARAQLGYLQERIGKLGSFEVDGQGSREGTIACNVPVSGISTYTELLHAELYYSYDHE